MGVFPSATKIRIAILKKLKMIKLVKKMKC